MDFIAEAQKLANFVNSLDDFDIRTRSQRTYQHMGATITDSILQAGLNYRTVVAPRVNRLLEQYPEAYTTDGFLDIINTYGLRSLINWRHPEKPQRIYELALLLHQHHIDTEDILRYWLQEAESEKLLLQLKGIGPKTIDYLKMLVGLQSIAVDRHIRTFVKAAGLKHTQYEDIRQVVEITAHILALDRNSFDLSIWLYISSQKR